MASDQAAATAQSTQRFEERREGNIVDNRKAQRHNLDQGSKILASPPRGRKRSRESEYSDSRPPTRKRQRYWSAPPGPPISRESNDIPSGLLACTQDREPYRNSPIPSKRRREEFCPTSDSPGPAESDRSLFITHWVSRRKWPKAAFEPEAIQSENMGILAKKKSTHSLRRKRSESSIAGSTMPSDQKSAKSSVYKHPNYTMLLKTKGVRMEWSGIDISDESQKFCQSLLDTECDIPEDTIFREDILKESIEEIHYMNESRVIQDIARLLVPSVGALAKINDRRLGVLIESVNQGWDNCFPLTDPRPQPDFAVGFKESAFGDERVKKLRAVVGDEPSLYQSRLMATHYMYFPFLTSEVKCGDAGLNVADLQNGHSMGVAVRAIIFLFQLAKRQTELHRRLLTFSVSHNHDTVRLHGWYPIMDGDNYTIHCHLIRSFNIVDMGGRDKWTTRKFSIGVYRYALTLLTEINGIIDELPLDLNLGDLQEYQSLAEENAENQPNDPQEVTAGTSITERTGPKRVRKDIG